MILAILLAAAAPANSQIRPNSALADRAATDILLHCKIKWPLDFQMQRYCEDQGIDGFKEFMTIYKNSPANLKKAILECPKKWSDLKTGAGDWSMIGYCSKKQEEAYQKR